MQKKIDIVKTLAIFDQSQKYFLQDNPGKNFLLTSAFEKLVYDFKSCETLGFTKFAKNLGEHITANFNVVVVK